ncbi:rho gtpase-activating protein [Anaeramoeba flamelloides]|uniref:Rho gtpase-activating protein n=1 Tax=Anaeramoeba flamelloides TaxID=1746091 RepID=A0ABQ8Z734_9EUKA|nr:rho gtpase-activating protein [Anaeramoeba flamelloides]
MLNHQSGKKDWNSTIEIKIQTKVCSVSNVTNEEQNKFFKNTHAEIFSLITSSFHGRVTSVRKNKIKLPSNSDYNILFGLTENLFHYSKDIIQSRWEFEAFYELLEFLCSINNKPTTREKGFHLLLLFVNTLGENVDNRTLSLIQSAINFDPFMKDYGVNSVRLTIVPITTPVIGTSVKEKYKNTKEERLKLFNILLDFISNKTTNIEFWIHLFLKSFIPTLYPNIAKQTGLLREDIETGFKSHCPYELQSILIGHVLEWVKKPKLTTFLFENIQNKQILLEIFRQSFLLPIEYDEIVYKVLENYKSWAHKKKHRFSQISENLQIYLRIFISHILEGFFISYTKTDISKFVKRCESYLEFLSQISKEYDEYLAKKTWFHLIDGIIDLTKRLNSNTFDELSKQLFNLISGHLFGSFLMIVFYTRTTSRYYWNKIENLFKTCKENYSVAVQWRRILLKLTISFHHFIFNTNNKWIDSKMESQLNPRGNNKLILEANSIRRNKFSLDLNEDLHLIITESEEEKKITSFVDFDCTNWSKELSLFYWNKFYNLLGNVNHIKNEKIHAFAISTYLEIYNLIIILDKKLREYNDQVLQVIINQETIKMNQNQNTQNIQNTKQKIINAEMPPIFELFTPIFFEACLIQGGRFEGRSIAYGAICLMICQPYKEPIDQNILQHFYYVLFQGLMSKNHKILLSIIRYSSHIFGYCLPGANGLINSFTNMLNHFLDPQYQMKIPNYIYLHSVILLSSMLSVPEHFNGTEIYDYQKMLSINEKSTNQFIEIQEILQNEANERENFAIKLVDLKDEVVKRYGEFQSQEERSQVMQEIRKEELFRQNHLKAQLEKNGKSKLINNLMIDKDKIRENIIDILTKLLLKKDNLPTDIKLHIIHILTNAMVIELSRFNSNSKHKVNKSLIDRTIGCIHKFINSRQLIVAETANNSLNTISPFAKLIIENVDRAIVYSLIKKQCEIIITTLSNIDLIQVEKFQKKVQTEKEILKRKEEKEKEKEKKSKEKENKKDKYLENNNQIIPKYLTFILKSIGEWILNYPPLLNDLALSRLIFKAIVYSLGVKEDWKKIQVELMKLGTKFGENSMEFIDINQKHSSIDLRPVQLKKKDIQNIINKIVMDCKIKNSLVENRKIYENVFNKNNPGLFHLSEELMITSEILLLQLLINWNNYPICQGPEQACSIFPNDQVDIPEGIIKSDLSSSKAIKTTNTGINTNTNINSTSTGGSSTTMGGGSNISMKKGQTILLRKNFNNRDRSKGRGIGRGRGVGRGRGLGRGRGISRVTNVKQNKTPIKYEDYSSIFAYKNETIISLHELPTPESYQSDGLNKVIRVILRDITGKYVWDFERLDFNNNNQSNRLYYGQEDNNNKEIDENSSIESKGVMFGESSRMEQEVPEFSKSNNINNVEMFSEMLNYIDETLEKDENNNQMALEKDEKQKINLSNIKQIYKNQQNNLTQYINSTNNINVPTKKSDPIQERKPNLPQSHWHLCRLFLSQFGFLSLESKNDLVPLKRSDRLERSLKELDKRPPREAQKIGVIYIGPGQTEQNDILSNEIASPLFEEFINGLGWEVDLKHHRGYVGGLDTYNETDGATAPYYADNQTEVIFHVITRMPNSKNNPKQINKKRHVGNDIVHIVWSENDEQDYDPMTITSQFNFAHIVIYPLPNGLFRIQIFMKQNVKFFGPLIDGIIVDKQSLPYLVRTTAMNANKLVRYNQRAYKHPFPTRWDILIETVQRYKEELNFEDYFSSSIIKKKSEK